jgi:hypothetical protein
VCCRVEYLASKGTIGAVNPVMESMMQEILKQLKSGQPSITPPPPTPPRLLPLQIPIVAEPIGLSLLYNDWISPSQYEYSPREYFGGDTVPRWKDAFGKSAESLRGRMRKVMPFLQYIDSAVTLGFEATSVLEKLETIMEKYNVKVSNFVKVHFYHIVHTTTKPLKNDPQPDVLVQEIENLGLPAPGVK